MLVAAAKFGDGSERGCWENGAIRRASALSLVNRADPVFFGPSAVWSNFASRPKADARLIDASRIRLHFPLAAFILFHFVAARAAE
jgi:hypothetical protein